MKDILKCSNQIQPHLPYPDYNKGAIKPSLKFDTNVKTPSTVLKRSQKKARTRAPSTASLNSSINVESEKAEINYTDADNLFPDDYDSYSKEDLISLLLNVEVKYRSLEGKLQNTKIPNIYSESEKNKIKQWRKSF